MRRSIVTIVMMFITACLMSINTGNETSNEIVIERLVKFLTDEMASEKDQTADINTLIRYELKFENEYGKRITYSLLKNEKTLIIKTFLESQSITFTDKQLDGKLDVITKNGKEVASDSLLKETYERHVTMGINYLLKMGSKSKIKK